MGVHRVGEVGDLAEEGPARACDGVGVNYGQLLHGQQCSVEQGLAVSAIEHDPEDYGFFSVDDTDVLGAALGVSRGGTGRRWRCGDVGDYSVRAWAARVIGDQPHRLQSVELVGHG